MTVVTPKFGMGASLHGYVLRSPFSNAVTDALYRVYGIEMPVTPARIWSAIQTASER